MMMKPQSAIGPHNYDILGNQRVGETHASRMARVNGQMAMAPTLVGSPGQHARIAGATKLNRPMGNLFDTPFTNPVAYGLVGGLVSAALAQLVGQTAGVSNKKQRQLNTLSGILGGAMLGASASSGGSNTFVSSGIPTWMALGGAAISSLILLPSIAKGRTMRRIPTGKKFKDMLRDPSTIAVAVGIPALIGVAISENQQKDKVYGGIVGAMTGAAMVFLGHRAIGAVYE